MLSVFAHLTSPCGLETTRWKFFGCINWRTLLVTQVDNPRGEFDEVLQLAAPVALECVYTTYFFFGERETSFSHNVFTPNSNQSARKWEIFPSPLAKGNCVRGILRCLFADFLLFFALLCREGKIPCDDKKEERDRQCGIRIQTKHVAEIGNCMEKHERKGNWMARKEEATKKELFSKH